MFIVLWVKMIKGKSRMNDVIYMVMVVVSNDCSNANLDELT